MCALLAREPVFTLIYRQHIVQKQRFEHHDL